uniref:Uncharacterized protein n=1 Tax=Trichogramma kaykai TaxID=54128 RepID=A0ABD2W144_9HYME
MALVPDITYDKLFQNEYQPAATTAYISNQVIARLLASQVNQGRSKKIENDSKEDKTELLEYFISMSFDEKKEQDMVQETH